MLGKDIFSVLAKYNSAVDENYLTEALVFLINSLLERERTVGLEILTQLCVKNDEFSFDANEVVSITTQKKTEQGIPDIRISSPGKLIFIEVKHDSPLGLQQLERYKKALESSSAIVKYVVLLTRFAIDFEEKSKPYKHVRWFEVYNWLASAKAQDLVSAYLIQQFKSFLEVKQMSIQRVGWEYINGIPALINLVNMIEVAIKDAGIPFYSSSPRAVGLDWRGFYLENKEFWCGIRYDNHLEIIFSIEDKKNFNIKLVNTPVYPIREDRYSIYFELQLEKVFFFSLDKDKQLDEITKFVKTAHNEAQQMRAK